MRGPARWRTLVACVGAVLAGVVACTSSVDPDQGTFSCAQAADCGPGYVCIAQAAGGGRCFPEGKCEALEICDGEDDDCNGLVDESFPGQGLTCTSFLPGVCAPGAYACVDGGVVCASAVQPGPESCNGLDDDCDGVVDQGFDLANDPSHCGACNVACPTGTGCVGGVCVERDCADGLDNDLDGGADCLDPACLGLACTADGLFNCGTRAPDAGSDGGFDPDAGSDGGLDPDAGSDGGLDPDAGSDGGFDPDAGQADAGAPAQCVPREMVCDDGADDDGDGLSDCADPDCDGRACGPGTTCTQRTCPGAG